MKTMQVQCPKCGRTDLLPVDAQQMPIVVTCPGCQASFMNYQNQCKILDTQMVQDLFAEGSREKINDYFWDLAEGMLKDQVSSSPATGEDARHIVTRDEITDLQIALGLTKTVEEFLEWM